MSEPEIKPTCLICGKTLKATGRYFYDCECNNVLSVSYRIYEDDTQPTITRLD